MAKKSKAKDTNVKVNLDELVNEGKNLNATEVNETWGRLADEIKDTADAINLDDDTSKLYEADAKVAEMDKDVDEANEIVQTMEFPNEVEKTVETTVENEENIDDVIAECTGEVEEKKINEKKPIKDDEPWYVARAFRRNDYFNW